MRAIDTTTATVTVVVTDLVGSTELLRLGPEVYDEVRRAHLDAVRGAVVARRGDVVKSTGDGILAVFTSAADAASAARDVQVAVHELKRCDRRQSDVRVGVACGEATSEDGDWYGQPVIEAARLCAAAAGAQILAATLVQAIVGGRDGLRFTPIGDLALKGFDAPMPVVEIGWSPPDDRVPLPAAAALALTGDLVGRDEELDVLTTTWKEVSTGRRQAVLVSGEPGVGKTRLVAEAAARAHAEGALVLWGRCDEDLELPHQPFVEAIRAWWPSAEPALADEVLRGDLARLLPEHGAPVVPALAATVDADVERQRLLAALDGFLTSLSAHSPVVLVLDDLQWAGVPTLSLLRHVVRQHSPAPILVLGTYRNTELDRTHPLSGVLGDLRRESAVQRISLDGLTVDGVCSLLEHAAGHELGEDGRNLAEAIHGETEGNPFFVGQVLHHLVETGAVRRFDGRWVATVGLSELGLPEGVREVVGRRLSALSDAANTALQVAAVVGHDWDLSIVEAVVAAPDEDAVLGGVEEAVRARLVREATGAAGRFSFVHALVRQALTAELTAARRARLHRRIAEALAAGPSPDVLVCAHHFIEGAAAGSVEEAARWTARAISAPGLALPSEEVIALAERALQVLDLRDEPMHRERAELLALQARHIQFLGRTDESKALADVAIEHARRARDPEMMVLGVEARAYWGRAGVPDDEAGALLDEAIAMPGMSVEGRAMLLAIRALWRAVNRGEGSAADDDGRRAVELALEHATGQRLLSIVSTRCLLLQGSPDLALQEEALDDFRRVQERVPGFGILGPFVEERMWIVIAMQAGDRAAVDVILGRPDADGPRDPISDAMRSMWRGMVALMEGRLDDADAHAGAMLEMAGDVNFRNSWAALTFYVAHERGTAGELVPIVEETAAATPGLVALRTMLAEAYLDAGRWDEAAAILSELVADDLAAVPRDTTFTASLAVLADLCGALGDQDAAAAIARALRPFAGQLLVVAWGVSCRGAVDRYLAMCASLLGDHDEAEALFAAALELEEGARGAALASRTRYWWGRSLVERGEHVRGRELLERSRQVALDLGQAALAREAESLLASL